MEKGRQVRGTTRIHSTEVENRTRSSKGERRAVSEVGIKPNNCGTMKFIEKIM